MPWPVDQPNPPVLPAPRVIAAREVLATIAEGRTIPIGTGPFPPGTPWNVMHMLLGYIAAVNAGDHVRDEYLTPTTESQPTD